MVYCTQCEAEWSGGAQHCAACHLTFTSTAAGDTHRVGEHDVSTGLDRRRCLTVDEMLAKRTRKGAPVFASKTNAYGTTLWRLWQPPNTRWSISHQKSEGRTDSPVGERGAA